MVNLLGVGEGEIENKKSSSCVPCLLSISPHKHAKNCIGEGRCHNRRRVVVVVVVQQWRQVRTHRSMEL